MLLVHLPPVWRYDEFVRVLGGEFCPLIKGMGYFLMCEHARSISKKVKIRFVGWMKTRTSFRLPLVCRGDNRSVS